MLQEVLRALRPTSTLVTHRVGVTTITLPSGNTIVSSHFTPFHQPGTIKDARGNYTVLKYDAEGNLTDEIILKDKVSAPGNPATYTPTAAQAERWSRHTYDGYGNRTSTTRVRDIDVGTGPTWTLTYDAQQLNVTRITRTGDFDGVGGPDTEFVDLAYDALGRQTTGVRADWYQPTVAYDPLDRVIQGTDTVGQQRTFQYDSNGRLMQEDLLGGPVVDQTTLAYDEADRLIQRTAAGGVVTTLQYDANGNLIKVTDPDQYTLKTAYDPNNQPLTLTDQAGHQVTREVDYLGRVRSVTDPNGNTTTFEYYDATKDGRLKAQLDPLGRRTTFG